MVDPVAFAQRLIRCPSVTPRNEGAMDALAEQLAALGFAIFRETFEEKGAEPVENLYARIGSASPNFCFAGHLDVVPVGDEAAWKCDPFGAEIRPDGGEASTEYLYGRGAEDMKGAIASFVAAAARLLAEHPQGFPGSLSLLVTLDEEGPAINGTPKMLQWLESRGEVLDVCLVGEPTNPSFLGEMIKIGRRGSMNCVLKVTGKQGHVAYPELADNPVTRLVRILHRLKAEPLDEGTEHFPPSNLEVTSVDVGNPASNVIAAHAMARFNIRFNDARPVSEIKDWLQHICEDEAPEFDLEMRVTGQAFVSPSHPLTEMLQRAAQNVTGYVPELSTTGGTSDARFIKDYCPVVEFGTTGLTAHQVNERVAVEDLRRLSDIYHLTLCEYFSLPNITQA